MLAFALHRSRAARGLVFASLASVLLVPALPARSDEPELVGRAAAASAVVPAPNDRPDEALEYFLRKRSPDGRPIEARRYEAALGAMRSMPRFVSALGREVPAREAVTAEAAVASQVTGLWTPLGPGNVGGRVRRLVIHPTKPNTMWAAAVAGGVWKTTNGGAQWNPTGDFLPSLAFSSLALSPANPSVLYAGSGEGVFNGDAVRGAGVFKTTNGGKSWKRLPATNNSDFFYVNDLVVSKSKASRVYAATRTGVWRSLDAGVTWKRILNPNVQGGCLDLALRTDLANDVLLASCGNLAPATVWRNKNAEAAGAWKAVLKEAGMGRTSLALAPSNQAIVYALASSIQNNDFSLGLLGVFRSDNGGETWTAKLRNTSRDRLSTLLLTNPVYAQLASCGFGSGNTFLNQGWYDNVIAVDPKDPNRVFTGGIDVFVSTDAGRSFRPTSFWWAGGAPPSASYLHADQHDLVFAPGYNGTSNRTLFVTNDGGVFRTTNARAAASPTVCDPSRSAFTFTNLGHGLEATQFYEGAVYPDGATYFGGTQDNGTVRGSLARGRNGWETILGGDGGAVAVDPTNTNVLYAENTGNSIQRSTDGGANFATASAGINDDGFLFIAPFAMDPSDPRRLWTGGSRIWRTTNAAASWAAASAPIGAVGVAVSALAIAPTSPENVLVGLSSGAILRNGAALGAGGSTGWPSAAPRTGFVSSVTFDPTTAEVAYATYSTFGGIHVWKTIDGGASWSPLDGGGAGTLPDVPTHVLRVDPANTSHLFLGTDLGVFVSVDGGASWAIEATGFPNVVTEGLVLQGDTLTAFTHGRGAWRTTIAH